MSRRARLSSLTLVILGSVVLIGGLSRLVFDADLASSQVLPAAAPGAQGFSADRLARIGEVMQQYVDEGKISGMVTLVARHGQVVQLEAYGAADREAAVPMSTNTMFRLASITKLITTAAVMQLMEEGRLLVTDPVSKYIPEFEKTTVAVEPTTGSAPGAQYTVVPARRQITLHDLLTKTGGIGYPQGPTQQLYEAEGFGQAWYFAHMDEPMCTIIERLPKLPFHAHPGEEWFNGYTTDILGCVIEVVSGMTLDDFLRTRLFEPLEMSDTYFFVPREKAHRLAAVYGAIPDGGITRSEGFGRQGQGNYVDGPRKAFAGGSGLVSTATDYARFLQMLLNGGELDGVRVLSSKTIEMVTKNHVGDLFRDGAMDFGFNVEIVSERSHDDRLGSVGTYGWAGAYFTRFWVDPAEDLLAVFLAQLIPYGGSSDLHAKFQALVYQALVQSEHAPAATAFGTGGH